MNQIFLPKAGELLDNAFAKARKQSVSGKMNKQKMRKLRAIKKIETVGKTIEERLEKTVKDFPSVEKMNPFAKEMLEATIDVNKTKRALAQFSAVQRIIKKIRIPLSRKIWATDPKQERMISYRVECKMHERLTLPSATVWFEDKGKGIKTNTGSTTVTSK